MTRARSRVLAIAAIAIASSVALRPEPPPALAKDADAIVQGDSGKALDAAVRESADGKFWGAVLAAKGGKILLAKGYGMADLAAKPVTTRSLFDIGSTSKQFTAAAVLRLAMQKRLSLDDPISKHLADVPADKASVTIRHLLHHSSGIPYPADSAKLATMDRDAAVRSYLATPLASDPGSKFAYSNIGYHLLAAIIERASGVSFDTYLRDQVFKPAGLADTGFADGVGLDKSRATARVATIDGVKHQSTAVVYPWNWGQRGATGVVTTVRDLFAWDRALRGDKILDKASKAVLHAPELERYACGWIIEETARGTKRAFHGGTTNGYGSQYSRWLDEDAVVVVLAQDEKTAESLATRLGEILFPPSVPR